MYFQVQEWSRTHGSDLLYFRPATQEEEVLTDDIDEGDYIVQEEEDDILYAEGVQSAADDMNTLLFIHQSAEQLHILKRCQTRTLLFKIRWQ